MSQLGNLSPEGSVAVGVIVCLLSSGIQSLGLTLQRKSHMLEETQYLDSPRPAYRRRRWQVGFSLFLVANLVGSTIQLSILPLPVLAALQAAGLVFNSLNATWILGEDFTRWSLVGTILVSGGAVLIAYFGALPEPAHSLSQLLELFARDQFIAWAIIQALLICLVLGVIYLIRRLSSSHGHSRKTRLARGMCYGALSGMLSAHSLLMAKSAVELLVRTLVDGDNQFSHWQAWIILLALVSIGLSQLYCLHAGLQLCSTSVLYPFVFCVYNVITILDGLIYFNQGSQLHGLETGLIVLGTLILLGGVFCLSWRLGADDASGPQPPDISENPLTPPVGVIGARVSPRDARKSNERQPLLSRSPGGNSPISPIVFRPRRASLRAQDTLLGHDEEAQVGVDNALNHKVVEGSSTDKLRLAKTRKRATFADFEGAKLQSQRGRSSTNPSPYAARRASVLSLYVQTKSRRITMANSRELWGELEEAGDPPSSTPILARSEIQSARLLESSSSPMASQKSWRRMSEGSGQVLGQVFGGGRPQPYLRGPRRRASDATNVRNVSAESGLKHGDPGQVVEDEEEEDGQDLMSSSTPLLQRAQTGRTYRTIPAETRQRRSSAIDSDRPSVDSRRRWAEGEASWNWHTIDASNGRPSDDDDDAEEAEESLQAIQRRSGDDRARIWTWDGLRRWLPTSLQLQPPQQQQQDTPRDEEDQR